MIDKLDNFTSKKMQLAEKLSNEKKFEESLQICDEIIKHHQDYYYAYHLKCRNLYNFKKYDEAYNEISYLISISSKPAAAHHLRAEWNLDRGEYANAIDDANAIIKINDQYFLDVAYFYKSLALLNLSNKKEALTACLKLPNDFKYGIKTPSLGFKVMTKNDLQALIEGS